MMPFKAFGVHGTVKVAATRSVTLQISKDTTALWNYRMNLSEYKTKKNL